MNPKGLKAEIERRVAAGQLTADPAQSATIEALDTLLEALHAPKLANKASALGWFFNKAKKPAAGPRGAYIWGGVGRGKSMLMDMFFAMARTEPKRRVHFHAFMQDVHARVHAWRQGLKTAKERSADPIPPLAAQFAKEARLLCFDEFAVTDAADAMILARLFTGLIDHGVTIVATSNVHPDNLYRNGLNRSYFMPFVALLKERVDVIELASATDYRMEKLINSDAYMTGDNRYTTFDALWQDMTADQRVEPATLNVAGRKLTFPASCGGLLRTDFDALCKKPLGTGDYLAIAERFRTVFIENIPVMQYDERNAAKRFIALIDTLYDTGRILIASAEDRPSKLYLADQGTEAFEFERTVSRLREMQSDEWLNAER
ncbi:MAG: cell division protein ZapE [Ahrensia sp.]|nr:cell division protein ZapE [Ahrensia sp.]